MKRVTIIGCGKVGKTLGRLWHRNGVFAIGEILNRSPESAADAAAFIGAGTPVADFSELGPADVFLIAAADGALASCAESLGRTGLVSGGSVVCHLSGALPSSVLLPAVISGGAVASVHPVRSFADPAVSAESFAGTWCGMEADPRALPLLEEAFAAIGGMPFSIDPQYKTLYHCGSVMVCNYLNALIEAGLRAYGKGGLSRETALQVMEPLVRGTLDNVFRVGPAEALTGPISRGDAEVVGRQIAALDGWEPELGRLYRDLGMVALELAAERQGAPELEAVREVLSTS
ncbi:Rossmann-like and DUF2520 domain-containing protein [Geomesophilobacter sediminis]|uniref:DUF2520 domain-containing protein n=1 Tax=Geomesophilobacter sediminis TaxID=2798584 RepID=A0A8J7M2S8_9BACT|nr:Rossmann-like and DUF2520 domain-containing protein [Geomesophilobacter sediminis]MBJ6727592.1 DUF2520 domain-containing protein [Geomesophilobacter sediminis]